jgi:hypothetical protein
MLNLLGYNVNDDTVPSTPPEVDKYYKKMIKTRIMNV